MTVDEARRRARERLRARGVRVLHEDNHLLVLAKPAGLLSQGGPAGEPHLVRLVEAYRREAEAKPGRAFVGLVHRLDRNVSGCLALAKTSKAASRLAAAFRDREGVRKVYLAWVAGVPGASEGTLRARLARSGEVTRVVEDPTGEGREAVLAWRREAKGAEAARLVVTLETGRTHQIRAQLAHAGHPLFGDRKYGGPDGPRPALHAWRLGFAHPVGGAPLSFEAPVPEDLRRLDRRLGLRSGRGRSVR